ncbi:Outer membrane protein beta-barrel domain-containing protein [Marinospirillum celere]|uniref:Outer membrane protein beta-barrel domain-containing protein n=1 Tax=Marinospirillum celere TaxID=1122252 RepID=A0A1I1IRL5_9GAMM|nr:outer membrane beta-barrel protein [Marinospirillum celere]SFC38581.1 Outer membrane protein beta-barrel domain-containing protein [Marinospirillum celere]
MNLGLRTLSLSVALCLFGLILAPSALANGNSQNAPKYERYFGIGLHSVTYDEDDGLWGSAVKGETEGSWGAYMGRKRNRILSTEFAYHHLGTYEPSSSLEISAGNFSYSLRLDLPLPVVQPYVLAGLGVGFARWENSWGNSDSGTGLSTRLGLGARIPMGDSFSIAGYVEQFNYDIETSNGNDYEQEFSIAGVAIEFHY